MSPTKCSNLQRPPTLQELADCLDKDSHICLVQPFPYSRSCKTRFDADDREARARATSKARSALKSLSVGASVSNTTFRVLLASIASDCCCSEHRDDGRSEQFAYHWIAAEKLDNFLNDQRWHWNMEKWSCLKSAESQPCSLLRKAWKPLQRSAVYCSLNRFAIFAQFPGYFELSFIRSAIDELAKLWTCKSHRKDADEIRYKLETDFSIHSCKNSSTAGIALPTRSKELEHSHSPLGVTKTRRSAGQHQEHNSSCISGAPAIGDSGGSWQRAGSLAALLPLSSSIATPSNGFEERTVSTPAASTDPMSDGEEYSPHLSPLAPRSRKLAIPVSPMHRRSRPAADGSHSPSPNILLPTIAHSRRASTPPIIDLTQDDDGSVHHAPLATAIANPGTPRCHGFARSVSANQASSFHSDHDPVTPARPALPKSSVSAPPARGQASGLSITSQDRDVRRFSSGAYAKPTWTPAERDQDCTPSRRSAAEPQFFPPSLSLQSANIEFHEASPTKECLESVAQSIFRLARQPARTKPRNEPHTEGWIYILGIKDVLGYVKIGRTKQDIRDRKDQIAQCKKGLKFEVVSAQCYSKMSNHERLEQLIHKDLQNERCYFRCPCHKTRDNQDSHGKDGYTEHGEWFRIDEEEACSRVEKWRQWMRQEPYDRDKEMKPDFRRRADYCEKHMQIVQEEDQTGQRWSTFMTPFYMTD